MANLTVQTLTTAGITPSYASAGVSGDEFVNDGNTMLHVKNGGGSPITITLNAQPTSVQTQQYGQIAITDLTKSIAAGAEAKFGPFPPALYNNANGRTEVTYSGVTSVTVAAFKLPRLSA